MKWQHFLLRVVAGSAIAIAFQFTTGFGSILQTAMISVVVVLGAVSLVAGASSVV